MQTDPPAAPARGVTAHARTRPDAPALVVGAVTCTYGELDARARRLAAALSEPELPAVIAAVLPNGIPFFETAVAAAMLSARFLPVNWHLTPAEVAGILDDAKPAVVVTDAELAPLVREAAGDRRVVVIGPGGDDLPEPEPGGAADALDSGPAWALMLYTSATTGRPKGVVHGDLDRERATLMQEGQVALWDWSPDDVHLLCGPAYHAGPGGWTMTALYVGACTVVMPRWDAHEFLRLVQEHRVTRAFMVPAHFIRLLEVPDEERARYDLSSLQLIVHAAAPCPVEVKRRVIDALPAQIWELYGASEGGATRIGPDDWLARPGSVGTPWPGVEIRILDPDGRPLGPGETGLIYIRPPGGARFKYHDDPMKTAEAWRDDAFTVGDVGHLDEDGYLYITDRASDMVIRGGVNVYPREVEEALHQHPGVVDCAVFGVPDERLGERLHAVVEVRPGVTPDDLRAFLGTRLADFKVPQEFTFVPVLPRDPNGKVLKRVLRAPYWADRPTAI